MTSLPHLKTTNSTGPIRPSQRQDIPRMHFTGVNMLILAQQPMAVQELCSRYRRGLDQVTWRRHEQHTCSNKEGTEDSTGPVGPIYHHMYVLKQAPSLSYHTIDDHKHWSCDCITRWWVPAGNMNPEGLWGFMTSHIGALGTVVNPPSSPWQTSYDLKAQQHHPWAKCTVSEMRVYPKPSPVPWQFHTQFSGPCKHTG